MSENCDNLLAAQLKKISKKPAKWGYNYFSLFRFFTTEIDRNLTNSIIFKAGCIVNKTIGIIL